MMTANDDDDDGDDDPSPFWFKVLLCGRAGGFQGGRGQGDKREFPHDPLPRRLGAEAWAFGRLHPRETVTFAL